MILDHDTQPTTEGRDLIKRWGNAFDGVEGAQRVLERAKKNLEDEENALGRWLTPDDGRIGECFCIWYGDSLIQATRKSENKFEVRVRKRGKSMM